VNVAGMIEWSARRHGDRTAFVFGDDELTFAEIDVASTRLANGLREIGVRKGDRVGILIGNRPEYAVAEFAAAKAGAVRVPLLVTLTEAEIARYLEFAEIGVVVASDECAAELREAVKRVEHGVRVVVIGEPGGEELGFQQVIDGSSAVPLLADLGDEAPYAIRFTGGTTGAPKAVLMAQRCMVSIINNQLLNWRVEPEDVGLSVHPLSHAAGMMMYGWWVRGVRHVIQPAFNFDPDEFLHTVEDQGVTTIIIIPTILNVLLDSDAPSRHDVSSLRAVVYGGAPIPLRRLREALGVFGPVFIQIYGTTEAPFLLTTLAAEDHVFDSDAPPRRLGSAGRVGLNVEVQVVDPDGRPVAPGQSGEIVSRGAHTMTGYWRNDELTHQRLRDGWVHTGDIGQFDEDGFLYIVDRKDDLVITGGFNVWPTEVEDAIYRHPSVREAAVFGVEHR
jgi:acyl-CoA synthetase (AMP-forming)/AMP-acid ligase II